MMPALADDVREPPAEPRGSPQPPLAPAAAGAPGGAAPAPAQPERIGRFLIREEIGRGSNGVVYSASDPVLGRDVAIKAIPLGAQPGSEAGFLQEAKIAAGLNHPAIVTVFDAGRTESIAYIAMERLKGADLHHWLAANRPMSAESAAALIARVADAVHFAHRRGLIHRDIKPSNIFLGRDMKPKVLDFGIALAQGQQHSANEPRKLIGTPNYMSPEQALGQPLDARSDVFSIGTILYELITGHRAFDGDGIDEILTKVVKEDPPLLSSWRAGVPPVMSEIIFRALAKDPALRYQTAGQLRNDLAAFAGRPVAPATSPPGETLMVPRNSPSLPGPGALLATGVAVLGLSLTFAFWYRSTRTESAASSTGPNAAEAASAAPVPSEGSTAGGGVREGSSDGVRAGPSQTGAAKLESAAPAPANGVRPETVAPASAAAGSLATAAPLGSNSIGTPAAALAAPVASSNAPASRPVRRNNTASAASPRAHAAVTPAGEPVPAPPPEPGVLTLAIAPWGEVFVDGTSVGVSPPLSRLSLSPGTHAIEVHNGGFPVYAAQVEISPGGTLALQHRF